MASIDTNRVFLLLIKKIMQKAMNREQFEERRKATAVRAQLTTFRTAVQN